MYFNFMESISTNKFMFLLIFEEFEEKKFNKRFFFTKFNHFMIDYNKLFCQFLWFIGL